MRGTVWLVVDSRTCLYGFQAQHIHFLTVPHWVLLNLSAPVFSYVKRVRQCLYGVVMRSDEVNTEKKQRYMETSSLSYFWLPPSYLPGNSILPHLEWLAKKPPLHLHPGKTQPEHSGAGLQTLCEAGGRRRADLPAQLHRVRGKTFSESWAGAWGDFLCGSDVEDFPSV